MARLGVTSRELSGGQRSGAASRRARGGHGAIRRGGERVLERSSIAGQGVSRALHGMFLRGGKRSRRIADLLHGTWLGHPLHPALSDITIGAWTFGAVFDAVGELSGDSRARSVADRLTAIGTLSAVPTALAGLTDYSTLPKRSSTTATAHALLNGASFALYLLSLDQRRRGQRRRGLALSAAALGANMFSAWLGGHLVFRERVGVDHSERFEGPDDWTPVLAAAELADGESTRIEIDGKGVMVHRSGQQIYAIGAVCSHAGGPLDEGRVDGCFVQCPWHDSVFDLRDGAIEHGPATTPQQSFVARLADGRIEIRAARS